MKNEHKTNYMLARDIALEEIVLCEWCGKVGDEVHHIIFRSQGGSDLYENLIGLCRQCHDRGHGKAEPFISRVEFQGLVSIRPEPHKKYLDKIKGK